MTHPQTPWWTQLRVQMWKQKKDKELGHIPWFVTLRGYRGMLELQDGITTSDKRVNYSHGPTQTKQQVG
jgi:hypothetical protein